MPITFTCACGKSLVAPDNSAGQATRCPKCGQALTVPGPQPTAQPFAAEPVAPPPVAWTNNDVQQAVAPARRIKSLLVIGGVLLTAALAVAAAWYSLGSKSSSSSSEEVADTSSKKSVPTPTPTSIEPDVYSFRMPVPGFDIPMDVSVWKGYFQIIRVDYEKDENRLVFLLQTERGFRGIGGALVRFLDADGVNLDKQNNIKFEHNLTTLKPGERTRLYLTLPGNDVLKKTKSVKAVSAPG